MLNIPYILSLVWGVSVIVSAAAGLPLVMFGFWSTEATAGLEIFFFFFAWAEGPTNKYTHADYRRKDAPARAGPAGMCRGL